MKKVIIIGAGPAGLTAGYELLNSEDAKDYEVVILEETQEIGGISRTVRYNGNRMDIGGHRFFSKDKRVMDLFKNNFVTVYRTDESGTIIATSDGNEITFDQSPGTYNYVD